MLHTPSLRRTALGLFLLTAGCIAPSNEDEAGASEDALRLEQQTIETGLHELRAGEAYIPGLDEAPVLGSNPCLGKKDDDGKSDMRITVAGGQVTSSAAIVYSRESLSRELGFNVSGTIPVFGGLNGAASLAYKTTFDNQSAAVVFQTTGTYDSVLTGADIPPFDVSRVASCGYGYVARAQHRVAAAMLVSVRSTASGSEFTSEATLGKAGIAEAKASLSNIVKKGHIEISIRFASDVIPELPNAPFADSAIIVGDSEEDKADALSKIDSALGWLAEAQSALNTYFVELQTNPESAPVAPTERVQFRYYPATPPAIRSAIELAAKNTVATRTNLAQTLTRIGEWSDFDAAVAGGHGFEWNIAKKPKPTLAALVAEKSALIDPGGKLTEHENAVSSLLETCSLTLRNDFAVATASELAAALARACVAAPPFPVDSDSTAIRPLAVLSTTEDFGSESCPAGLRRPTVEEAPLFEPWSRSVRANAEQGLWLDKNDCVFGRSWLYEGAASCSPFLATKGFSLCVPRGGAMRTP